MERCVICLSSPPRVTFHPCKHNHLCAVCAVRLQSPRCPICRNTVEHAVFEGSKPCTKNMIQLQIARESYDLREYSGTMQVLVVGPRNAAQLGEAFVERICKLFSGRSKGRLFKGGRDEMIEDDVSVEDALDGLPYDSPFRANAVINGNPARFSWLSLAQNEMTVRECVAYVQAAKPDFLLLAAALQLRSSFAEMLAWDHTLRRVMGSTLPKRMWVFLAPPKVGRFAWASSSPVTAPNCDFYDGIAEALNSIPELFRPLTYHVVEPSSFTAQRLRKVAQRSVFHAAKGREMDRCEGWT